jgi:hypothetical protein
VSFDIYFVDRQPGQSWADAVPNSDADEVDLDPQPLKAAALATWDRVKTALAPVLPNAEEFAVEVNRELNDDATGIQVSIFGGDLTLMVPYWYSGPDAERLVGILHEVAAKVEQVTGLTAYDPQADAPFLGEGENSAAATFSRVRRALAEHLVQVANSGQ